MSESEEVPMTIHIGMLANDGIVLAGDTKAHTRPLRGLRHSYSKSKIKVDPTNRVAITCAVDLTGAEAFADRIIANASELKLLGWRERERRIREIGGDKVPGLEAQCIVAFADPEPDIYFFQCSDSNGILSCERRVDPIYSVRWSR